MKVNSLRVTVTTGRPDPFKAVKGRFKAMRRAPSLWSALLVIATSLVDLVAFALLCMVFAVDNLIRRVARDLGMPFRADVPMYLRVGVFSFLMTLVFLLVPSGVVMAAFAVTNNDFYTGIKPMPQPADSGEVTVHVTANVTGTGAINDVIKLAKLPADCVQTGWELTADDLDTGTNLLTTDFGILNAAETAVSNAAADGGKWLTASGALTGAPGYVDFWAGTAAEKQAQIRMSPSSSNRSVGLVVIAAGNAAAAANAKIDLCLWYRPAYYGL